MTEININHLETVNSGIVVNTHTCTEKIGVVGINWNRRDDKVILIAENAGSEAVTLRIAEGNGIAGKGKEEGFFWIGNDVSNGVEDFGTIITEAVVVPAKGTVALALESSRFKWVSGVLKGKVLILACGTLKICVISEP